MKLIREVLWIIFFTFVGEILNASLPLPVPAGVYGLILMLIFLMRGIIRLDEVEQAGNFLLETMSIMFLPAAVGTRPLSVYGDYSFFHFFGHGCYRSFGRIYITENRV